MIVPSEDQSGQPDCPGHMHLPSVAALRSDRPKHRKHHDGHLKNPALESTLPSQGCRYAVNSPCGRVIATSMRQTQIDFNSSGTICSMRLGASNSRQAALRASSRDGPDDACPVSDARSEVSCVRFRETHASRTGCPSRSRPGCVLEARRRGAGRRRDGVAPGMGPRRSGRAGDLHRPGPAEETPRGQAEAHRGHLRSGAGARGGRVRAHFEGHPQPLALVDGMVGGGLLRLAHQRLSRIRKCHVLPGAELWAALRPGCDRGRNPAERRGVAQLGCVGRIGSRRRSTGWDLDRNSAFICWLSPPPATTRPP